MCGCSENRPSDEAVTDRFDEANIDELFAGRRPVLAVVAPASLAIGACLYRPPLAHILNNPTQTIPPDRNIRICSSL